MRTLIVAVLVGLVAAGSALTAVAPTPAAAAPPAEFDKTLVVNGLDDPSSFRFAPNGDMYIAEQAGAIKLFHNGVVTTVGSVPTVNDHEKGLLGIELDKNFATNHYLYASYTHVSGFARLSRFTVVNGTLDMSSEFVFYQSDQPASIYHNANDIHYGPDGKIWWSVGDNLATGNSQSLQSIHGKLARFDVDGTSANDNPWHGQADKVDQIYSLGFRNPFRFTFLPNGKAIVGDVGGALWEEMNIAAPGANFGWPLYEGDCGSCGYANPVFAYPHGGVNSSITALALNDGNAFPPQYQGALFYGDYARGMIRYVKFDAAYDSVISDNAFDDAAGMPVDMHFGPDGNLYYASIFQGDIYKISLSGGDRAPVVAASANPIAGLAPLPVSFSSAGTYDPDGDAMTYAWNFGDGTTSNAPNPSHTYTVNGTYDVTLTVSDGDKSDAATVKVTVGNRLPVPQIDTPTAGAHYNAGDTISYSASATDPEDGTLPASAFSWTIMFQHAEHQHHYLGPIDGATSGSFTIGRDATNEWDTWYRLYLTVTDSGGLSVTTTVDIYPNLVNLKISNRVPGAAFTIDGNLYTTTYDQDEVVGVDHGVTVESPQTVAGHKYRFLGWSDGGGATHTYRVPSTASTLTADMSEVFPISSPWQTADLGSPALIGTADYAPDDGVFTLEGGGKDLWTTFDQGRYVWQSFNGDGEIVARVTSQSAADPWTKSGLVIRESTAQFAPYAMISVTPANGIVMQASAGKNCGPRPAYSLPVWLKLRRIGNTFTGSYSSNGTTWTQLGQCTVTMANNAVTGMFAISHTNGALTTTAFDNVTVTSIAPLAPMPSPWTTYDVGAPAKTGSAGYDTLNQAFVVNGGGADLWTNADEGRYVTQPLIGDGVVVARVTSQTAPSTWTKSGLVLRDSSTPFAAYAMIAATPGNGIVMQYSPGKNCGTRPAFTLPVWLKLQRMGNTITGSTSSDGQVWTQVGQCTTTLASSSLAGMFVVSHSNTAASATVFDHASVTPTPPLGALPVGWSQTDVGTVKPGPGSATYDAPTQTFTVRGGGYDVYYDKDDFHYVYQPLVGDGEIVARVTSQTNTNNSAKAGVMIKQSPIAFAPYSFLAVTPTKGSMFQWSFLKQSIAGGAYTFPNGWVRLTRVGDVLTAYRSTDGVVWTQVAKKTVVINANATIGLFVTSHNSGALGTATFDHVSVTP